MAITDLEREKIAAADKKAQRKANTLGADRPAIEEPFGNSSIVLKDDLLARTPTANTSFPAPDYGDAPTGGSLATRHIELRLHPLITSGMTGLDSIQTFVVVHTAPESDDPVDIERVRIKHLVPPDLSIGRSNAGEDDHNLRGFEMALYPAYPHPSNDMLLPATKNTQILLGLQDGYFDGYQITLSADPGAEYGIGSDARITVDYANGIVRLSTPPLLGPEISIINPFDMYGDIDGYRVDYGRPTLFATFYQYTGPNLSQSSGLSENLVTVGDGTDSYGSFYGPTSQIMQEAVDSLWPLGGTVFVNGGNYSYDTAVTIPDNVSIIGLSHDAKIWSQSGNAIFTIIGGNSSVQGLQLYSDGTHGAVEFAGNAAETMTHVRVLDNIIWSNFASQGISFAPRGSGVTYSNLTIRGNQFKTSSDYTTYIGEVSSTGDAQIVGLFVAGNYFDATTSPSYGTDINGTNITLMSRIRFDGNHYDYSTDINLNNGLPIDDFEFLDSYQAGSLSVFSLIDSMISQSTLQVGLHVDQDMVRTTVVDGYFGNIYIAGSVSDSKIDNVTTGTFTVEKAISHLEQTGCHFLHEVSLRGDSVGGTDIDSLSLSNNRFDANVYVSRDLLTTGTHTVNNVKISDNSFQTIISIGGNPADGAVDIVCTNMSISGNTFQNVLSEADAIRFGSSSVSNSDLTLNHVIVESNDIIRGDISFLANTIFSYSGETASIRGNKFEEQGFGVYFVSTTVNNVEITENSLDRIVMFGESATGTTMTGADPATPTNILIARNLMKDSGSVIAFAPVSPTVSLTLTNARVIDNVFLDDGSIVVLNSSTVTDDYRIEHISVDGNKMPHISSSITVGPSVTLTPVGADFDYTSISNNDVLGTLTVGGITTDHLTLVGNAFTGAVAFNNAVSNSVFSNNNAASMTITGAATSLSLDNNTTSGALLFSSTLNTCSVQNNNIGTTITHGLVGDCIISGNTVGSDYTGAESTDSSFSDLSIVGDFTLTTMVTSTINNVTVRGANGIVISSLDACTISSNIVGDAISVSGTVVSSSITGNRSNYLSIGGTTNASTITGNVTLTGGASFIGALTNSTITSNSFQSTTTASAFTSGTFTDCVVSNNLFKSTNGAEAVINFGNMVTTVFDGNNIEQAAVASVTFGTVDNSKISQLIVDATAVACGTLTKSSILNTYIGATFTILDGTNGALVDSDISDSHFVGAVTLTMTSNTNPALSTSKLSNNSFEAAVTVSGAGICLADSIVQGNSFGTSLLLYVTSATGTYALQDSIITDNIMTTDLLVDNNSGSASTAYLVTRSVISNNSIGYDCSFGYNLSSTNATSMFTDVTFIGNRVGRDLSGLRVERGYDITTYNTSVFSGNVITGNATLYGALVGCSFSDNSIAGNASEFDLLSGSNVTDNLFGADGYGIVILHGGIQNNGAFGGNFVSSNVNIPHTLNTASFTDNNIGGSLNVNAVLASCNLSGNIIASTSNFNDTVTSSSINDNKFGNALNLNGTLSGVELNGNYSAYALYIAGAITDLIVNGNRFGEVTLASTATKTEMTIVGNVFANLVTTGAAALTNTTITGNRVSSAIDLSPVLMTKVAINDNVCYNLLVGSINSSSIDGNTTTSTSVGTGFIFTDVDQCSITNNTTSGYMTFSGAATETQILGNTVESDCAFSDVMTGISFTGNVIGANAVGDFSAAGAITDCMFAANDFEAGVTFPGAGIYTTTFTGNHIGGNVTVFSGGTGFNEVTISNNVFDGTFANNISTLTNSSIIGNVFAGAVYFTTNVSSTTPPITTSMIDNNNFGSSLSISFYGVSATGAFYRSTLSGNRIATTLLIDAVNTLSGSSCYESTITGNVITGTMTLSTNGTGYPILVDTAITGNVTSDIYITHDQADQDGCVRSVVDSNKIGGQLSIDAALTTTGGGKALDSSVVSNNTINGNLLMCHVSRDGDQATYEDSIVSGNSCLYMRMTGKATRTNVVNNTIAGAGADFYIGALWDSRLSGNMIADTVGTATIALASGAGSSTLIYNSIISDNDFSGIVSIPSGTVSTSRFMNNRFSSSFSAPSAVMSATNFGGNYFGGSVTTDSWSGVSCFGNQFVGAFLMSTAAATAIQDVAFHNNVCKSTVQFTRTSSGTTNNYLHSSFVGNVFTGTIVFGTSGYDAEFTRVVFNSNSGDGGLSIYQGASSEMDSCMIVGNSMSGALYFANGYPSPPTSGISHPMIALNWFTSYTNITFSNDMAIGWGDNSTGATINLVVGSNLASAAT